VASSSLRRSELASIGIAQAKEGHTMGALTMALFYAADFADRMQREIIPALRAGFVVLTDRYMYSLFARCIVRGVDPDWIRSLMGFALVPDAVLYLRTTISVLLPRVLNSRGFDHWESGMDFLGYSDYYESYIEYQTRMLRVFDELGQEYGFQDVDATKDVHAVFLQLRDGVQEVVRQLKPPQ